jgi:hypothetical protein
MSSAAPFLVTLLNRVKAVVWRVARPMVERARPSPLGAAILAPAHDALSPASRATVVGWMRTKRRAL